MDYYGVPVGMLANGNIPCAGFVTFDPSNDDYALPASAGGVSIGVAYPGTNVAPIPTTTALAAIAGQPITVYMSGAVVEIQVGTVNVSRGFIKADANALAINANPGDIAAAIIYENANANEFVTGQVLPPGFVVPMPLGSLGSVIPITTTPVTATAAQNGSLFYVTVATASITLPLGTVGLRYFFILGGSAIGTAFSMIMNAADALHGNGFTALAGHGATDATAVDGDWIEVECLATNVWFIRSIKGTWTRL